MSFSPIAQAESLRIGTIEFVSPDEIKIQLDIEAPDSVALNAGIPRAFPRINGYVLIPSEEGHLVGQIEWITIENAQYPKRKGMQDFGLIDLPYPLRKMRINPLGILAEKNTSNEGETKTTFRRGVGTYPTVGDPVLLPTQRQLHAIVESGENRRVKIGVSPLAGNADVMVDPNRLFGRHLAVLGNTGSGKSCTVAGLIRWSLNAARTAINSAPNARFIVLDPNGEYSKAFSDMEGVSLYAVEADDPIKPLRIPLWFWNSEEWCAFTQVSGRAQRPTLIQALRTVRDNRLTVASAPQIQMRRYLRTLVSLWRLDIDAGNPWAGGGRSKGVSERCAKWKEGVVNQTGFTQEETTVISTLSSAFDRFLNSAGVPVPQWPTYTQPNASRLLSELTNAHTVFGGSDTDFLPIDADVPKPFTGDQLLQSIEATAEQLGTAEYIETMLSRIRTLLSDAKLKAITGDSSDLTLVSWLEGHLGVNNATPSLTVIDLSLVPSEVTHIITAVVSRVIFEAMQRYRKLNSGRTLPTVLVMEEAHTFIKRYKEDAENQNAASVCCQVFEKIAREGRKFGLGLVLSSQRPSELSPTVLSQCNTYLLHRISNDKDQDLVNRLVPDNLRGLLRDLPSLPSRQAILLGWASELPMLVEINRLPESHRPESNDPDFWNVWTRNTERPVDWNVIANDWQQMEDGDSIGQNTQAETQPTV